MTYITEEQRIYFDIHLNEFKERHMTMDPKLQETLDKLHEIKERLDSHDWYYHYSDDHSVWVRGVADWREIQEMVDSLGQLGKDYLEDYKSTRFAKEEQAYGKD